MSLQYLAELSMLERNSNYLIRKAMVAAIALDSYCSKSVTLAH